MPVSKTKKKKKRKKENKKAKNKQDLFSLHFMVTFKVRLF